METSQEPRISGFLSLFFFLFFTIFSPTTFFFPPLSLHFRAIRCPTGSGPTASRCSHSAPRDGLRGVLLVLLLLLLVCLSLRDAFCFHDHTKCNKVLTRKHWQVPRSGSNLCLGGLRARGSSLPLLSSIIRVLQPLQLKFWVPFHKLLSLLFSHPLFCWLLPLHLFLQTL